MNDTMTLEEAIMHCQEKSCGKSECALEHKQLAEWLRELQYRRNIWKDPSQKPKVGETVLIQLDGCQMYIGEYFLDEEDEKLEGVLEEPSRGWWNSWKDVEKWAYPKDVFPFSSDETIELFDYSDGESKRSSGGNRELESHKAWEASLLIADRLR